MSEVSPELPYHIHDRIYKFLLSFPHILKQLIQGYVDVDWKDKIVYERCERVPINFISEELEKCESDVLYKVPLVGDTQRELYLYILIENQSTIDWSMAFRLLNYIAHVWTEVCKKIPPEEQKKQSFRLPLVFPIVLYNGASPWNAPMTLQELLESQEFAIRYLPNLEYYLIDIAHYDLRKLIAFKDTLTSVFMLENQTLAEYAESPKKCMNLIQKALKIWEQESNDELIRGIVKWLVYKLKTQYPLVEDQALNKIAEQAEKRQSRKEFAPMIETNIKHFFDVCIQEGKKEGKIEGTQNNIVNFLQARFGSVPGTICSKIQQIQDIKVLDGLVVKAATVQTLDEFEQCLPE